jgi:predicted acyltransferase (DUF342 family)
VAFREHLAPHLEERQEGLEVHLRRRERVVFHDELVVAPNTDIPGIVVVRGQLDTASGVKLQEAWIQGDANLDARASLRGLACDGSLHLGEGTTVGRWIDSEHDTFVGPDCNLGMSATAVGMLSISPGCSFQRLWGNPIRTLGTSSQAAEGDTSLSIGDEVVWAGDQLSIPPGAHVTAGIVAHGELHIGKGAVIEGTVKADDDLVIEDSVQVIGNVIGRKSVRIGRGCQISGNIFGERDVVIGSDAAIASAGGFKTVYAAGSVTLGPCAAVFGWVVAERGGNVLQI